ncbi:MAG: hypothetical protein KBG15_11830 [Kofleriaceae bacterium]|nr:hypothetical protein [Kofleriaceae bacterium]
MKILSLLVVVAATSVLHRDTAHAEALDDAKAAFAALPGIRLIAASGMRIEVDGPGFVARGLPGNLEATVWKGDAGWNGALRLTQPNQFALSGVDALGRLSTTSLVLVVTSQNDVLRDSQLPTALKNELAPYFAATGNANRAIAQGVNIFMAGTAGPQGVLGQLGKALGSNGGAVRIRGTVGEDLASQALTASGTSQQGATPAAGAMALQVMLPAMTPAPFNMLSTDDKARLNLEIKNTTLAVSKIGDTVTFGGAMLATVTLLSKRVEVDAKLTFSRSADGTDIAISGTAAAASDRLFGIQGLALKSIGIDATLSDRPSAKNVGLGVAATVAFTGGPTATVRVAASTANGRIRELSLGLVGSIPIKAPSGGEALAITNPQLGLMVESNEGFISGGVSWRGTDAQAVLVVRTAPVGAALFIQVDNFSLQRAVDPKPRPTMRVPVDVQLGKTIVILSSLAMNNVPLDKLPSPATSMLASVVAASNGVVTATQGLTMLTVIDPSALPALGTLGVTSPVVLAGSIGVASGKPTIALYADLPAMPMPAVIRNNPSISLASVKPRMFLQLSAASQMAIGIETRLGLKLDSAPLTLDGRFFVALSATGGKLEISGALLNDWVAPFAMNGATIKAGTAIAFAISTDGAAQIVMAGNTQFDDQTFELAGGVNVLFSTGIPLVKGLALRLAASEISAMTPAKVGQILFRGMANSLATTLASANISAKIKNDLVIASRADLVALMQKAIPTSQLSQHAAALSLRNVEFYLLTPGMDAGPAFPQFSDVGISAKGTLKLGAKTLGSFDGYLTTGKGFQLKTSVADFDIGPMGLKDAALDIGFGIPLLQNTAPHFMVKGALLLNGQALTAVDVTISETKIALAGMVDIFGNSIALAGSVGPGDKFSLSGSQALNLPKIEDVNFPRTDASFTLSNETGLKFSFGAKWEGAKFDVTASYISPTNFSMTGSAAADSGTKEFKLGDIEVGRLTVEKKSKLSIKLTPNKSVVKFDGAASFRAFTIKDPITKKTLWEGATVNFDFPNVTLASDLRIRKKVRVFDILKLKEVDFEINYRVFP